MKHRADLLGMPDKYRLWALRLPTDHGRSPAPHDGGLLAGDLFQGVAEEIHMVQGYRRNDARKRLRHHIGGIEPAAEPDFEEQHVGRVVGKQNEGGGGFDLEYGDRRMAVGPLAGL